MFVCLSDATSCHLSLLARCSAANSSVLELFPSGLLLMVYGSPLFSLCNSRSFTWSLDRSGFCNTFPRYLPLMQYDERIIGITGPMTPRHHTTPHPAYNRIPAHHISSFYLSTPPFQTYTQPCKRRWTLGRHSFGHKNSIQCQVTQILGPYPMGGSHSKHLTFTHHDTHSSSDSTKATKHGST